MSTVVSSSFAYPWVSSGRVVEPPGLELNIDSTWVRLKLAGDLGVDIPPNTQVHTPDGWLLPLDAVGQNIKVNLPSSTVTIFGTTPLTMTNTGWYKVVAAFAVSNNDVRLDQTGHTSLGGPHTELSVGVITREEQLDVEF